MPVTYPVTAIATAPTAVAAASGNALHVVLLDSNSQPRDTTAGSSLTLSLPPSKLNPRAIPLVRHLAINPDATRVVAVTDDKAIAVYSLPDGELVSTRYAMKKCSDVSFTPSGDVLYSDKVGDVYVYPLVSTTSDADTTRPSSLAIQSDPTLNPDASLLLGHVSIATQTLITPDGKHIISADRDEHIRISRYPVSYVIERFLFGSDGFVSALHLPGGACEAKDLLISAGGERWMRVWDWRAGKEVGQVDVWSAVMPHRRARSAMRKKGKKGAKEVSAGNGEVQETDGEATFYSTPEGWHLPAGQGVCVKKITSVQLDGTTVVLFFSEGAAAVHAFVLDPSTSTPTFSPMYTFPLPSPILDLAPLPSDPSLVLISLDTAFGVLKQNHHPTRPSPAAPPLSPEAREQLGNDTLLLSLTLDAASPTLTPLSTSHPLLDALRSSTNAPANAASDAALAALDLYPLLPLLPRWIGQEDEDAADGPGGAGQDGASEAGTAITASSMGGPGVVRNYTQEELAGMSVKQLGRLKSKGVDVSSVLRRGKLRGSPLAAQVKEAETESVMEESGEAEDAAKRRKVEESKVE